MDEDFQTTGAVTHRFVKGFGIAGLSIIVSLGLASRVDATYLRLGCACVVRFHSGDFVDEEWFYLLDYRQYDYPGRGQYCLLGGLSYQLGYPCYPKPFETYWVLAVGFTNRANICWIRLCGGRVPISGYAVWSSYFSPGDYIDRGRYYFLDKGQYYYLDRG